MLKSRMGTGLGLAFGFTVLSVNVQALPVSLATNFTGSSYAQSNWIPPDTDGAIGGKYFAELLNGQYAVYDTENSGVKLQSKTLDDFWRAAGITASLGTGSFDPRILFDPYAVRVGNTYSGRWFAASVDNAKNANHILVAVSDTPDPTSGWHGVAIDSDTSQQRSADFPQLGFDRDVVVVSTNMFCIASATNCSGTQTAQLVLPKADLLAGSNPTGRLLTAGTETGLSAAPAVSLTNSNLPIPLLSSAGSGTVNGVTKDVLKISSIDGDASNPTLNTTDRLIYVDQKSPPADAAQEGSTVGIDAGDKRFSSSVISQVGDLWGVQTISENNHAALRWFHIDDPLGAPTVVDSGIITGDDLGLVSADLYYGSIAVNSALQAVIGFTASSDALYASAYAIAGQSLSRNNLQFDLGNPFLLAQGQASYVRYDRGNNNRWGDYSATVFQSDNSYHFWTIQEWASAENQWSTQIAEIVFGAPEPSSLPLVGLALALALGSGRRTRLQVRAEMIDRFPDIALHRFATNERCRC